MFQPEASRLIESLRLGIPPDGAVSRFTVGRADEIEELRRCAQSGDTGLLYIKANYGIGKTHILRLFREFALDNGYAVSLVSLDATANVRFNRMDQIIGAVMRGLQVPCSSSTGVRCLFDTICRKIKESRGRGDTDGFWYKLTNRWQWNESDECESITMFVALRAWATEIASVQELVEDWLFQPWSYYSQRKRIYQELIGNLHRYFRDAHPERYYYPHAFQINVQAYDQSWKFLRDLRRLSQEAGLRGVIVLFDEFEKMLTGLVRSNYKVDAFWNVLQFGRQKQFSGMSVFAITPEFFQTLGGAFLELEQFKAIEMQPLDVNQLCVLAKRIRETHSLAFGWRANTTVDDLMLLRTVQKASLVPVQDRSRQAIRQVVRLLDHALDGAQ